MNVLLSLLFVQLCGVVAVYSYTANVYRIVLKRLEVSEINAEYMSVQLVMKKLDRYNVAASSHIELKKPLTSSAIVIIRVFEFLNNEYRPFAINYQRSLCSFFEMEYKTMIYPDLVKIGANMPEPKCPVPANNYSFENYVPHENNFPLDLPFKNVMLELKFMNGNIVIGIVRGYAILDRDVIIRERYG